MSNAERYSGWSVHYRNPGHWDICTPMLGRIYTIRGEAPRVLLSDERKRIPAKATEKFETVSAAILWVADELMRE